MLVKVFQFEAQSIRTQTDNVGALWFNANDVCSALGFGNPHQALSTHVNSDDLRKMDAIDSIGRTQQSNHINESGVYSLVFGSTLPDAKRFKRWVTSEVLPTIRKTGSYSAQKSTNAHDALDLAPKMMAAAMAFGLDKNAAAISSNQAILKLTGTNVLELLGHTHLVSEKQNLIYTPTELGAQFLNGISARRVNSLLAEAGLQFKEGDHWKPLPVADGLYRLLDTGKKHGNGTPVQQLKWFEEVSSRIKVDPE